MKKVLLFVSCALFVAAMASCGNKNAEETTDSVIDSAVVEEPVAEEPVVEENAEVAATEVAVDNTEMLSAAKKAGQAKCNCYKKDAASVEACIKAILSSEFAAYQGNTEFKAAMDREYQNCIKEKAKAAATDAANKAVSAAAKDISKKLQKNN